MTNRSCARPGRAPAALSVFAAVCLGLVAGCSGGNGPSVSPGGPSSAPSPGVGSPTSASTSRPPTSAGPSSGASSPVTSPSQSTGGSPGGAALSCGALVKKLSVDEQIGQLFMAGTQSSGMPAHQAQQLAELKVGSVLLLGNTESGRDAVRNATDTIRERVGQPDGVKLILAADQEGGQVQRLAGPGFDTIPSAVEQGELSPSELTASARTWGEQLRKAGIDVDLAPVADVVPDGMEHENEPIGQLDRGYGSTPKQVESHDVAFITGMQRARIGTAVKHFPNLGRVRGNTDFDRDVTDQQTSRHDKALRPYRGAIKAGVDMVMVASATYTRIDADHPATFSSTVVTDMIRGDLGFQGVIISDDLIGKALDRTPSARRAEEFIRAGGDLAIVGDPQQVGPMVQRLRSDARDDAELRDRIRDAAQRVLIMKARYGLADCRSGS